MLKNHLFFVWVLLVYMILIPLNIHIHPWTPKTCHTVGLDCFLMSSILDDFEILLTVIGLKLSNFGTKLYQKRFNNEIFHGDQV